MFTILGIALAIGFMVIACKIAFAIGSVLAYLIFGAIILGIVLELFRAL